MRVLPSPDAYTWSNHAHNTNTPQAKQQLNHNRQTPKHTISITHNQLFAKPRHLPRHFRNYSGGGNNYSAGFNSWRIIFKLQLQDRGPQGINFDCNCRIANFPREKAGLAGPQEITGLGPPGGIIFKLQLQELPSQEFKM